MALSVEFRPPVGPPCGLTIVSRSRSDFLKPQMSAPFRHTRSQSSAAIASRTVLSDANKYVHGRTRLIVLRATIICVPAPFVSGGLAVKVLVSGQLKALGKSHFVTPDHNVGEGQLVWSLPPSRIPHSRWRVCLPRVLIGSVAV